MVRLILLLVLLVLLAGLGIGSWYALEEIVWKPERELRKEQEIAKALALEDPSLAAFREISEQLGKVPPQESVKALREFLEKYPSAPDRQTAIDTLNRIGRRILFTPEPAAWKTTITVVKGDSLDKISRRMGVAPDYLLKINNLLSHNLQIGQTLVIPKGDFALKLKREAGEAELLLNNEVALVYPAKFVDMGGRASGAATVREKVATVGGTRVVFGSPGYASSEKSVILDLPGVLIQALPEVTNPGETPALPRGILLSRPDLEEIFLVVKRGTSVIIE